MVTYYIGRFDIDPLVMRKYYMDPYTSHIRPKFTLNLTRPVHIRMWSELTQFWFEWFKLNLELGCSPFSTKVLKVVNSVVKGDFRVFEVPLSDIGPL